MLPNSRFFFAQFTYYSNKFTEALEGPESEYDRHWSAAEDGQLAPFGEFTIVDSIAREYIYTHDQVTELSWSEVMTIIVLRKKRAAIETRAQETYRAANKRK